MMLRVLLLVVTAAAAVRGVAPQQDPPPSQVPTFRTGTKVVRVDATVLDRRGNPVTHLTADDFEVHEDGQPQAITSFKFVEASGEPTDDLSLAIRGPEHARAEAARDDVRLFLIFWDEYHIEEFRSARYAKQGFERIMLEAFGPTDLVGIMDQLTPVDAIRFSRDRRALANHIHGLKGRWRVYVPPRSFVEEEHLRLPQRYGGVELIRGQVTRTAIRAAVAHLGTLREGRKTLVIVSESAGPFRDQHEAPEYIRDLTRAANDSNTAIYVFDPRGLTSAGHMSSVLETIAYASGGEPLRTNDVAHVFPKVVRQSSAFYLLGYAREMPEDGKFHEIKVRVKKPGLQVRARSGYWAPRAADVGRARERAAAGVRPPEIEDAFAAIPPLNSREPIDVWAGVLRFERERSLVAVAWTLRDGVSASLAADRLSLTATAADKVVFEGPIESAGSRFLAPPGTIDLAFTIHDRRGDVIGRVKRTIAVPDPAAGALTLTTPAVLRSRSPSELKTVMSDPRPPLHAGRQFARADRLLVRFDLLNSREVATVSARLLDSRGNPLVDLAVRPDTSRGGYSIDLPLSSIARGEYVIRIEARDGDSRTDAHVALRVVR